MTRIMFMMLCLLALAVPVSAAPILGWDAVTTDTEGLPLGSGLEVIEYRVYQCGSSVASCSMATGILMGTVPAPATSFDLAGQPMPRAYFVTAVNKASESAPSAGYKIVPPDVPKNLRLP